ncbi:MAG: response regulator [Oxalobacteraceae bacterium]|nr:MAG: response regulator [Oxalobacteraceae bacterium]
MADLAASAAQHLNIVLMEDSQDHQLIINITLSMDIHVKTYIASSNREYWEIVKQGSHPDVFLISETFYGKNKTAAKDDIRINTLNVSTPFIVLTTNGAAEEEQAFREAGAIGVIVKPFNPLTLTTEIRRILREHD